MAVSDNAGNVTAINRYDEYGKPQGTLSGRFGYTGQAWLPEIGLYNYKARLYDPRLGRFMQTDPIGYGDGLNIYVYVGGDPVNFTDPSGLQSTEDDEEIVVVGERLKGEKARSAGTPSTSASNASLLSASRSHNNGQLSAPSQVNSENPPPEACAYKDASGRCAYVRDAKGKLKLSRGRQRQVCANFTALQDGATKTNDGLTALGVGGAVRGGLGGGIIGAVSTFAAFISSVTTGAGFRPFGLTLIPKFAPPAGCK